MNNKLAQRLESRHVNMIAIGGSIGTGIFLASGYTIFIGGPGSAVLAYSLMSLIVYFLMTSLGEMSAYQPSSGSFCDYSTMYVGKSFGFAMGYNYWFNWAVTIALEISAASLIMTYWFKDINPVWFSLIFFLAVTLSNIYSVRLYGEIEYWLSFMKVATIIIFIVIGLFAVLKEPSFGIHRWSIKDAPFHHGYYGFITAFLIAGFSFQGTELVGVASGETKNPEIVLPKSIKMVFWRLTLFYVLSILIISLLIDYTDVRLATQDDVANVNASIYTLVFSTYLSKYSGDLINFVILIAVVSAANASMYSATRILWYLGEKNQAPKMFAKINKHSVPSIALFITAVIGSLVFISKFVGNGKFFTYILMVSSLSGFLAWFGIALSHYKFRKNFINKNNLQNQLKYKAKFFPFAQIIAMISIILIIALQAVSLDKSNISFLEILGMYFSIVMFLILYICHKLYRKVTNPIK